MPYSHAHFRPRIQIDSLLNFTSGGTRETSAFKVRA